MKLEGHQPQADLTVVIPVFNGLPLLQRAVNSLIAQTSSNWRAVIVDNCSDDPGMRVFLAKLDRRFEVQYRATQVTALENFFYALMDVNSPLVCFLAHDDVLDAKYVEVLADKLTRNPKLDGVCPSIRTFAGDDPLQNQRVPFRLDWTKPRNGLTTRYIIGPNFRAVNAWYGVFRTRSLQSVFQEAFREMSVTTRRSDQTIVAALLTRLAVDQFDGVSYFKHRPEWNGPGLGVAVGQLPEDWKENSQRVKLVLDGKSSEVRIWRELALSVYTNTVWSLRILVAVPLKRAVRKCKRNFAW